MRVLLIANHSSVFGKELFDKLNEYGKDVALLDFESLKLCGKVDSDKYSKAFAKYRKLPKIHMIFRLYFIAKFLCEHNFDVVNIHTSRVIYTTILPMLSNSKLVTTIYGSDFYRQSKLARKIQKFIYTSSSKITFTNPLTMQSFLDYYGEFGDKSVVCRFGLGTLDVIEKNRNISKDIIKKNLGYSATKTIITCGYNATKAQQHEAIIESISKLDNKTIERVQFIFPMTYGDKPYRENIKKILTKTNLDYIVLEEFLYDDNNANIKLGSDIMINMLKTDSFSGSMQEFLYGSNVVITGSWLPYEIFDKEGIMYKKINNPSELSNILIEVMNDLPNLKMGLSRNIDIISNLSSWDNNIQSWIDAYEK